MFVSSDLFSKVKYVINNLTNSAISTMLTFLAAKRIMGNSLDQLHDQIVDVGQKLVGFACLLRDFHEDSQLNLPTLSPSMSQNSRLIENVQSLLMESAPLASTETEGRGGGQGE